MPGSSARHCRPATAHEGQRWDKAWRFSREAGDRAMAVFANVEAGRFFERALAAGRPGFVLVDTRSEAAWAAGRVPGAIHLPGRRIADLARERIAPGTPVVVYCWGPGCNGAQKAALELTRHGRRVKKMLGGFEYWVREGQPVEGRHADRLSRLAQPELVG